MLDFGIQNILPYDGEVFYYPNAIIAQEADEYYSLLDLLPDWESEEYQMFGKKVKTKRKIAYFSPFSYTYSGITKQAKPFPEFLQKLSDYVSVVTGFSSNACLCNIYHSGNEGMGWHSDNEKELGNNPIIISVSFGQTRTFQLKHNITKKLISIPLNHGDILVMKGATQANWKHQLRKNPHAKHMRINCTFRTIEQS